MSSPLHIKCRADHKGRPLRHTWSVCVGAGRANEGLRADWQRHLALAVRECGFQFLRFHGLFHDDMFVYREDKEGKPIYNWQYVDALFDAMLDLGIRPFVELGFSPLAMASVTETVMWWKAHGSPPKDYARWADLVTQFIFHCRARYGPEELRQWYFEVWNEPNLRPFFAGSRSQYFELYRVTAKAIKAIDAALRVGGPATSNLVPDARFEGEEEDLSIGTASLEKDPDAMSWRPVWLEQFLAWCAEHNLPVDFVSTHPYPTDFALDGYGAVRGVSRKREAIIEDLLLLRETVLASPYPQAEIHCTEWNSSPSCLDHTHDFPQAATYVVMANLEGSASVDSLSHWTFTDVFEEDGAGDTIWHGGFGLINLQGLPKPTFHAYRFLHRLGSETIAQGKGYIVTRRPPVASAKGGHVAILLYNYPDECPGTVPIAKTPQQAWAILQQGTPKEVSLTIHGLPAGAAFALETLDANSGWARGAWEKLGRPEPPNREQTAYLLQAGWPPVALLTADGEGNLTLPLTLNPWAVLLVDQLG